MKHSDPHCISKGPTSWHFQLWVAVLAHRVQVIETTRDLGAVPSRPHGAGEGWAGDGHYCAECPPRAGINGLPALFSDSKLPALPNALS